MAAARTGNTQYAALPYRIGGDGLQILLITSRDSGRWIIPKGWPIAGLSPSQSAAREALEEAGVTGRTSDASIGCYPYDKRLSGDAVRTCEVEVFALEVTEERDAWPEQHQRRRQWLSVDEAAAQVNEAELGVMIREWAKRRAPAKPRR